MTSRFRVLVTPDAQHDIREIRNYIRARAPKAAGEWSNGIRRAIQGLGANPMRCPKAPENEYFEDEVLELLYGKGNRGVYRILFTIIGRTVFVLHVRHGSRLELIEDQ